MILNINKYILLEEVSCNLNTQINNLFKELKIILKQYNISNNDIIIFGSIVLGINKLRCMNDLDICIKKDKFEKIQKLSKRKNCKIGSDCAQMDFGKISFIHEDAVPKINNKNLFDLDKTNFITKNGYKIINKTLWIKMKKQDPQKKDYKYFKAIKYK